MRRFPVFLCGFPKKTVYSETGAALKGCRAAGAEFSETGLPGGKIFSEMGRAVKNF